MKNYLAAPGIYRLNSMAIVSLYIVLLIPFAAAAQSVGSSVHHALEKDSLGKYRDEIQVWNSVIRQQPAMAQAWHLRGRAKLQLKDYRGAIADQQRAAQLQPCNDQVYLFSAYARLALKQYKAALADFGTAIRINPSNSNTWYHRAFIWQQLGQAKKARLDISRANQLGLETSKDKLMGFEPE